MRPGHRRQLARLAAPAALLLAGTIAVLAVRAGLDAGEDAAAPPAAVTTGPATTGAGTRPRFYVIRRGDTLASVAEAHGITVERLRELNPTVDPVALTVGQRIRVA